MKNSKLNATFVKVHAQTEKERKRKKKK